MLKSKRSRMQQFFSNSRANKMSVCKTIMLPYCHTDTGSGTIHLLISKELIIEYGRHLRKEQGLKPNQFHKRYIVCY